MILATDIMGIFIPPDKCYFGHVIFGEDVYHTRVYHAKISHFNLKKMAIFHHNGIVPMFVYFTDNRGKGKKVRIGRVVDVVFAGNTRFIGVVYNLDAGKRKVSYSSRRPVIKARPFANMHVRVFDINGNEYELETDENAEIKKLRRLFG